MAEYIVPTDLGFRVIGTAEQAKATGGMVALFPRVADAEKLVVLGGEPLEDLHLTVTYFGEDVRGQDPTELVSQLDYLQGNYGPIEAQVFGFGWFNPVSDEPCAVYLIGGNPDLTHLHMDLKQFALEHYPGAAEQHDPWTPHITAGYGLSTDALSYQGPVTFDRFGLRWPEADEDFPL